MSKQMTKVGLKISFLNLFPSALTHNKFRTAGSRKKIDWIRFFTS